MSKAQPSDYPHRNAETRVCSKTQCVCRTHNSVGCFWCGHARGPIVYINLREDDRSTAWKLQRHLYPVGIEPRISNRLLAEVGAEVTGGKEANAQ